MKTTKIWRNKSLISIPNAKSFNLFTVRPPNLAVQTLNNFVQRVKETLSQ